MRIDKNQGYNQNFKGLLKFNNVTINPNHIVKSNVFSLFHDIPVNRKHGSAEFYNVWLEQPYNYIPSWFQIIGEGFRDAQSKIQVLVNDAKEGLTKKTFNKEYLTRDDRYNGIKFHNLKFLTLRGTIELTDGKKYQLENARCLIQYPTLKEINITIDKEGNRINEKFEPFTKNITSWDELWSKTMKEDIVVDIDTDLKKFVG